MATGLFRLGGFLITLALAISTTNSSKLNAFNLTTTQAIPFSINGARVTFSNIPFGNETTSLRCILQFSDGSRIEDEPTVTADKKQVVCRLPPNLSSGKVQVDLEVTDSGLTQVYSQSSILTPDPTLDLKVVEDWANNALELTWNVDYFKAHYPEGFPIHLQATIQISDGGTPTFLPTTVTIPVGFNDPPGTKKVTLTDTVIGAISNFRYPYFYMVRPAASTSIYLTSGLLTPTLGTTDEIAQDVCSNWLLSAVGPPHVDEIIPCPNCHCKAKLDPNFIQSQYSPQILQLAEGQLANHELFYQRVPTASGHAQSCSYNVRTTALATSSPVAAAWINFVSKDISYVENYLSDSWPYYPFSIARYLSDRKMQHISCSKAEHET